MNNIPLPRPPLSGVTGACVVGAVVAIATNTITYGYNDGLNNYHIKFKFHQLCIFFFI